MKKKLSVCFELFSSFFRIGLFTIGGGLAMLPIMQKEAVEKKHWADENDVLDMVAISEATPGVLAINMATFTGYRVSGFWGALAASLGVVLPSFVIIMIISVFYSRFRTLRIIDCAFKGLRAGVVVLLFNSAVKFGRHLDKSFFNILLVLCAFGAVFIFKINSIIVIIASAAIGIVYGCIQAKKALHDDNDNEKVLKRSERAKDTFCAEPKEKDEEEKG